MRFAIILGFVALAAQAPPPSTRPAPVQPIPYSHKQHIAAGLQCRNCHEIPEPGDFAGIPATSKCMTCHTVVKKDSPAIEKLAAYHRDGRPVPWARVYRIPDYVFFSHKEHLARSGATCETCHGPVAERDVMRREKDISMQGCMECHRTKSASLA
ncbi:MAG: cytochrome c3 family protein, partial [Bryobacteraceae bacterium]